MITMHPILGNSQKLDGGSMYGNCPRAVWERWSKPDAEGRIDLACRAMLIEVDGRRILLETGIGAFFEPKLKQRFGVVEDRHVLLDSLRERGLGHDDIDAVVLSHLHFDHAGGLLSAWSEDREPELLFPKAKFFVGKRAWDRALKPHSRDRASFISGLTQSLESSGRLTLIDGASDPWLGERFRFHSSDGHTPGLLLTEVATDDGPIVFAADLIPGVPWVHLPITMGYDRYPELLIDEKKVLLEDLIERNGALFFTHDPTVAAGRIVRDEKGRFGVEEMAIG